MKTIKLCTEVIPKATPLAARLAAEETEENLPVTLVGTPLGNPADQRRTAGVILTGKKWQTGRTLRVCFAPAVSSALVRRIWPYFLAWSDHANVSFEQVRSTTDSDVRVSCTRGDGSWSYLGTDALTIPKNEPTMNFGWLDENTDEAEFSRVVLHEVGHLLGMPHEHQHPRAGIPWDAPAVYRYYGGPPNNWDRATIDRNLFARYSESHTSFSDFDRQSIMLYPIPNELTVGDYAVGWNTILSETDKRFIAAQYPGRVEPEPPSEEPHITMTALIKRHRRGVTERTLVKRDDAPWIYADPVDGSGAK